MLTSTSLVYSTDPVPVKPPKAKSAGLVLAASFGVILLVLVLNISAWVLEIYCIDLVFFSLWTSANLKATSVH